MQEASAARSRNDQRLERKAVAVGPRFASKGEWVEKHVRPASDYVMDLFSRHQAVILGEFHNVREHKEFVIDLIPRLYREAGVRVIGWEFSRYSDNARLRELVTSAAYDPKGVLDFARDQVGYTWNSKEHWDIIRAVWELNHSLPSGAENMALVGLQMDIDLCKSWAIHKSEDPESDTYRENMRELLTYDRIMADHVSEEIVDKGKMGLVFVGRCHEFTHYEFPPEINFGREIMGRLLYKKYGDRVFEVWLGGGLLKTFEPHLGSRNDLPVGFDVWNSPFAEELSPPGWDAPGVPIGKLARGLVYFGPGARVHVNTCIPDFVAEKHFQEHRKDLEIDLGRSFSGVEELNAYLMKKRWAVPGGVGSAGEPPRE